MLQKCSAPMMMEECEEECKEAEDIPKAPKSAIGGYSGLLASQVFNGSFPDDSEIKTILSSLPSPTETVIANAPKDVQSQTTIWLTLLALAILELKFAEKKSEWELIAKKAKKYLKDNGLKYKDYIDEAKAAVQAC